MIDQVASHYSAGGDLARKIAEGLRSAGKNLGTLKTTDLAALDEFHFRGREATLELAARMKLFEGARVLDIGSGLGGPARTLAEEYGCHVTGIDLATAFCDAATIMSGWLGLGERTDFVQGDATALPFADGGFDAAMTVHVAMNIAARDKMYEQARRVLKPGGIFAIYDILQGEGGKAYYPAPWARDPSISYLASRAEMERHLTEAGFGIVDIHDSSAVSLEWMETRTGVPAKSGRIPVTTQILFGEDYSAMAHNQIAGLRERRIRTVSFICEA